jgi:hypothetical protein
MSGIIGSKGLDDMPLFCSMERQELLIGLEKTLREGTPHNLPAAVPIGSLGRIAATLKAYEKMLLRLIAEGKKVELLPEGSRTIDAKRILELGIEAARLLNVPPPITAPTARERKKLILD